MTIGFDATSILGHSGIEVYARELIRGISALQLHDAKVVLMGRRRRGKQLVEYFGDQVEVRPVIPHDVMLGYRLRPVSRVFQNIAWKANSQGVDLMHLPGNALWRTPSNKYVVTIHDVFPLMPEMDTINASRREFKSYVEATSKKAQRIIVPTQWAADSIVDYLPHTVDKIRVVHHSIREQFTHRPLNEARARELGLRIGARYLFFVGRVDPRKILIESSRLGRHWMFARAPIILWCLFLVGHQRILRRFAREIQTVYKIRHYLFTMVSQMLMSLVFTPLLVD